MEKPPVPTNAQEVNGKTILLSAEEQKVLDDAMAAAKNATMVNGRVSKMRRRLGRCHMAFGKLDRAGR